jgi:threonine synthase
MTAPVTPAHLTHFACGVPRTYEPARWRGLCECGRPLAARYDWNAIKGLVSRDALIGRTPRCWRHRGRCRSRSSGRRSLGGLYPARARAAGSRAARTRPRALLVKDESPNPTGSFKARPVPRGHDGGRTRAHRRAADAGNAGGALAAVRRARGSSPHVFVPKTARRRSSWSARARRDRHACSGFIHDAGRRLREVAQADWFDLSTLKEPFRAEGQETMGYELAEQGDWRLPDVVVYPTGGGTGLVGMWKAFEELEALGWIEAGRRPRMVSVQVEGCARSARVRQRRPRGRAVGNIRARSPPACACRSRWATAGCSTCCASHGAAVAVGEDAMLDDSSCCRALGVLSPRPRRRGARGAAKARRGEARCSRARRSLFNTGSGLKYLEAVTAALNARAEAKTP